jgi:FKBP-type peptidyl-prolyl cis-trans isomerase FklB
MRLPKRSITSLFFILVTNITPAAETPTLDTDLARESYTAGYHAVIKLQRSGRETDLPALLRGALDALAGTPLLGAAEMQALLKGPAPDRTTHGVRDELTPIRDAEAFLAANANQPGVKVLPSGLQYKVLSMGTGNKPKPTDSVVVHYRGSRVDGKEIGNTYSNDSPETYRVDEVMPGWAEALLLMPAGSEWELYIPSPLAYGKRGPLENQALIYLLKLLSVIEPQPAVESPQPSTPR